MAAGGVGGGGASLSPEEQYYLDSAGISEEDILKSYLLESHEVRLPLGDGRTVKLTYHRFHLEGEEKVAGLFAEFRASRRIKEMKLGDRAKILRDFYMRFRTRAVALRLLGRSRQVRDVDGSVRTEESLTKTYALDEYRLSQEVGDREKFEHCDQVITEVDSLVCRRFIELTHPDRKEKVEMRKEWEPSHRLGSVVVRPTQSAPTSVDQLLLLSGDTKAQAAQKRKLEWMRNKSLACFRNANEALTGNKLEEAKKQFQEAKKFAKMEEAEAELQKDALEKDREAVEEVAKKAPKPTPSVAEGEVPTVEIAAARAAAGKAVAIASLAEVAEAHVDVAIAQAEAKAKLESLVAAQSMAKEKFQTLVDQPHLTQKALLEAHTAASAVTRNSTAGERAIAAAAERAVAAALPEAPVDTGRETADLTTSAQAAKEKAVAVAAQADAARSSTVVAGSALVRLAGQAVNKVKLIINNQVQAVIEAIQQDGGVPAVAQAEGLLEKVSQSVTALRSIAVVASEAQDVTTAVEQVNTQLTSARQALGAVKDAIVSASRPAAAPPPASPGPPPSATPPPVAPGSSPVGAAQARAVEAIQAVIGAVSRIQIPAS